jgi:hypothetical protein
MSLPILLASPVFAVWFKWSCLLALGWGCHGILRHRHARWRLILWRSILCFGLILPWFQFFEIPGIKIPIAFQNNDHTTRELAVPVPAVPVIAADSTVRPNSPTASVLPQVNGMAVTGAAVAAANSLPLQKPARPVSWEFVLIGQFYMVMVFSSICPEASFTTPEACRQPRGEPFGPSPIWVNTGKAFLAASVAAFHPS